MKLKIAISTFIILILIPIALFAQGGGETTASETVNADSRKSLNLIADFSSESSNNRNVIGFTKADSFGRYDNVMEEKSIDLKYNSGTNAYTGTINIYYQMDNLFDIKATLNVETPFKLNTGAILPATMNVTTHENGKDTSEDININSGASKVVYEKSKNTMWEHGYLPITFTVKGQDVTNNLNNMSVTTTATLKLVVYSK